MERKFIVMSKSDQKKQKRHVLKVHLLMWTFPCARNTFFFCSQYSSELNVFESENAVSYRRGSNNEINNI